MARAVDAMSVATMTINWLAVSLQVRQVVIHQSDLTADVALDRARIFGLEVSRHCRSRVIKRIVVGSLSSFWHRLRPQL